MKDSLTSLEKGPVKTSELESADLLAGLAMDFNTTVQLLLGADAAAQYAARQHEIASKVGRILLRDF